MRTHMRDLSTRNIPSRTCYFKIRNFSKIQQRTKKSHINWVTLNWQKKKKNSYTRGNRGDLPN